MSVQPLLPDLLSDVELANELQLETSTLANWRWSGRGPDFVKYGRQIKYRREDVDAWLASQVRRPTTPTPRRAAKRKRAS
jgi:hypothetical protein